jgi:PncC family amidohydrolase
MNSLFPAVLVDATAELLAQMQEKGQTLSVAESCTGGLLSGLLTEIPGASRVFWGGAICYDNTLKQELGVFPEILENFGAVSKETASALASAARGRYHTDFSLSITGIAGPSGGTAEKPVGTVFMGLARKSMKTVTHQSSFTGDRQKIRMQILFSAVGVLKEYVSE